MAVDVSRPRGEKLWVPPMSPVALRRTIFRLFDNLVFLDWVNGINYEGTELGKLAHPSPPIILWLNVCIRPT